MTQIYQPWTYLPEEKRVVDEAGKNVLFVSPHCHTVSLAEISDLIKRADRIGRLVAAAPELEAAANSFMDALDGSDFAQPLWDRFGKELATLTAALRKADNND